jgi:hypothetical protein
MMAYEERDLETMPIERLEGVAMDMAGEVDQFDTALSEAIAPEGDFSMDRLNGVVDALNDVVELIPDADEYPVFEEDIEVFPMEFVNYFDMINMALNDAAMEDMVIELETIADDKDLARLTGQLKAIAKNGDFKRFMKNQYRGAAPVEEEVVEEVPMEMAPMEEDMDNLFMERM